MYNFKANVNLPHREAGLLEAIVGVADCGIMCVSFQSMESARHMRRLLVILTLPLADFSERRPPSVRKLVPSIVRLLSVLLPACILLDTLEFTFALNSNDENK